MKTTFKANLLCFMIFLLLLLISGCQFLNPPEDLAIHVLDVGQGDSILIISPNGKTILIDAGETDYGQQVVRYLKTHNITEINWLIGTHPHSDHIGGLIEVIENFKIGELYIAPVLHTSKSFENLLLAADKKGLEIKSGRGGHSIEIAKDLSLGFLGPIKDYGDDLNNWSIINQLRYKNKSFIFMGDAEYQAEVDLMDTYSRDFLRSHFIKIGHHGSNSSTGDEFLRVIEPDVAVISSGKNNTYGHPHGVTLQRMQENKVHLYRTDIQGTIIFYSNGKKIWSLVPSIQ